MYVPTGHRAKGRKRDWFKQITVCLSCTNILAHVLQTLICGCARASNANMWVAAIHQSTNKKTKKNVWVFKIKHWRGNLRREVWQFGRWDGVNVYLNMYITYTHELCSEYVAVDTLPCVHCHQCAALACVYTYHGSWLDPSQNWTTCGGNRRVSMRTLSPMYSPNLCIHLSWVKVWPITELDHILHAKSFETPPWLLLLPFRRFCLRSQVFYLSSGSSVIGSGSS